MSLEPHEMFSGGLPKPNEWLKRKLSKMERPVQEKPLSSNAYWLVPVMKILLFIFILLAITFIEAITKAQGQSLPLVIP